MNRKIVDGYKFQFAPYRGGPVKDEPYYDPVILRKGKCFVDVGANIGGWTIPAAKYYDQVFAFEPNPKIAKVLKTNVRLNGCKNVIVYPFALGDDPAVKEFHLYPHSGEDSFLPDHQHLHSTGQTIRVRIERLDNFDFHPSVLKLDTEGYEIPVLKGGMSTIRRDRPWLLIETHLNGDADTIEVMLDDYEWNRRERNQQAILIGRPTEK